MAAVLTGMVTVFKPSEAASQGDNGFVHSYLLQNTLLLLFNWHSVDVFTIPNKGESHHLSKPAATGLERWLANRHGPEPKPTERPWQVVEAREAL